MFFWNNHKLEEKLKQKDEQISTLHKAIQELGMKLDKKLKEKTKKYKALDKKLDAQIKELTEVNKKLDHKTRELKESVDNLERITNSDTLTGAYNKRYFYDVAESVISLAKREKQPLSLAMIDINNFKNINSTYGYSVGDEVLQTFVHTITYTIRESDVFVRFEEKEFVILFPNTNVEQALNISEKIRKTIESCSVTHNIDLTISIGLSELILSEDNINSALKKASAALIKAEKNSITYIDDIKELKSS